jgi:hypothetical protein
MKVAKIIFSGKVRYTLIKILMMLFNFFKNKKSGIKSGDYAKIKKEYKAHFPIVPMSGILNIEEVKQESATVVFFRDNEIYKQSLPLKALYKVG